MLKLSYQCQKAWKWLKKTFNPKLGIVGGISILGTSGIVEPMSDDAFKESLKVELAVKLADLGGSEDGHKEFLFVFGNFGRDWLEPYDIPEMKMQKTSNFVAYMLEAAKELGIKKLLYVGHLGKMVKLAAGMDNTHSKYGGDKRMASILNCAQGCGLSLENQEELLLANTSDEAVDMLKEWGGKETMVLKNIANKCKEQAQKMGGIQVECILFSTIHGELSSTDEAKAMLNRISKVGEARW